MPILFLASAMVSGTGLLIIVLPLFQKFFTDFKKIDYAMIARLARLLAWFIVIDLVIRFFWLTFAITFNSAEKYPLSLFFGEHLMEVIVVEYILCLAIPMIIGFSKNLARNFWIVLFGGILSAVGVWLFRWNTVIGGQSIGKTTPFLLEYHPHLFGPDSIFSIVANWSLLIALIAFVMVIFPWDKEMAKYYVNKKES
jgi:tetrathionate reductase subunit C